ncbi:MAG: restriction endonuclease [Anaerolineaceae bacterium]|nr:restriction endonuclease [Anaerolineaceae bacterium]
MESLDATEKVLLEAGEPLHYGEITQRMLKREWWQTDGKTPDATVNARITVDIKRRGELSRFMRTAPGIFALRQWGLKEYARQKKNPKTQKVLDTEKYSFTDAAEVVLENFAEKQPMHYRQITDHILELKLVDTEGQTPEATLYAMVLTEIKRHTERGATPRFVKYGRGLIGLRKWMGEGLAFRIEQHNLDVRKKLLAHISNITPDDFEQLLGLLLSEMGFENIEVTKSSGDGGIDVRGTLVVGDVIRTTMAVQAKKWKHNVQSPIVQQVRGSLGTHEQGMIITTSGFSKGAQKEAARADAIPVALVNGEQLVDLLIEHHVLTKHVPYELIYLDTNEEE